MVGLFVAALALRLVDLGARPMHHDESLDAWWSWRFREGLGHRYDPAYHGPLRFYLTAGFYRVLGEGEAVARLLAALCGAGLVLVVGSLRRWLGNVGSLAAAVMLSVSPSMLYFSRFGREDLPFALCTLAVIAIVAAWLTRPEPWQPAAFGAVLAAAFALKETSFILVAVLGTYLGLLGLAEWLDRRSGHRPPPADPGGSGRHPPPQKMSVLASLRVPGWSSWALGGGVFAFVFAALFSVGFTDLEGIRAGAFDGLDYWLSQQPVNRGSQPWPFHLVLLAGYEWPIVALALVGGAVAIRRLDPVRGLLVWCALANLVIYSWASERYPWLVVHPLLALILVAGIGAQALWNRTRATVRGRIGFAVGAGAVTLVLVILAVPVVYLRPSSAHHLMVAVQTSEELLEVRERIDALHTATEGAAPTVVVDSGEGGTWPWAWYLRDRSVRFVDLSTEPEAATEADLVVALATNVERLPGSWTRTPFVARVWWLPPWEDAGARDWLGWITIRRPFGELGALDAYVLEPAPA